MRAAFPLATLALLLASWSGDAQARAVVDASPPRDVSVTIYRDPGRGPGSTMNRSMPQGFAMISETRQVTLPPGESTIRFEGVAEGMVAVSAIVTGLPGGTIEKNRNADLLSPAALVDGTLGNRVTVTRTNPATGEQSSEQAVIRTRADGGLVLQTGEGYEAVRCSGLPEGLSFGQVPAGLSAQPVFTIDTQDRAGGTYQVELTYLAWGFDWQAHYVATFGEKGRDGRESLHLRSWLTLLNDNGQSFADAQLLVVAGELSIVSDFAALADPPEARPLRLTCYPLGSTAAGSPMPHFPMAPPPPPSPVAYEFADSIMVTAARGKAEMAPPAMVAEEEDLGDLKLYRVPERVTVAAKSLKQIAFLDRGGVRGDIEYRSSCSAWEGAGNDPQPMQRMLTTKNDRQHGLGVALPMGGVTLFEPSWAGDLLVGEEFLSDHAEGQDVEIALGASTSVFALCRKVSAGNPQDSGYPWIAMRAVLGNSNAAPVRVRVELGSPAQWRIRGRVQGLSVKDGQWVIERTVRPGGNLTLNWEARSAQAEQD